MNKLFSMDGKLYQALSIIADLVILNLLWLFCSIPIVTLGASTSALYHCVSLMVKEEDTQLVKEFFHGFRTYWKNSTLFWAITVIVFGVFLADIRILPLLFEGVFLSIFTYIIFFIVLLFFSTFLYFGPVLVQFNLNFKLTVKNAFLLSISHLPITIVIATILIAPIIYCFNDLNIFINCLPFIIAIGGSAFTYLSCLLLKQPFAPHLPKETDNEKED